MIKKIFPHPSCSISLRWEELFWSAVHFPEPSSTSFRLGRTVFKNEKSFTAWTSATGLNNISTMSGASCYVSEVECPKNISFRLEGLAALYRNSVIARSKTSGTCDSQSLAIDTIFIFETLHENLRGSFGEEDSNHQMFHCKLIMPNRRDTHFSFFEKVFLSLTKTVSVSQTDVRLTTTQSV